MASMLFAYKGRSLNPPSSSETGWGTGAQMLRLERLIAERGLGWWLMATSEEVQAAVNSCSAAVERIPEEKK